MLYVGSSVDSACDVHLESSLHEGRAEVDYGRKGHIRGSVNVPYPALLVLGPFMQAERQAEFMDRAAKLKRVDTITFHGQLETLVSRAAGVVSLSR